MRKEQNFPLVLLLEKIIFGMQIGVQQFTKWVLHLVNYWWSVSEIARTSEIAHEEARYRSFYNL